MIPVGFQVGMPGKSEAGARIHAEVDGKPFGSAEAGANGRFKLEFPIFPGQSKFQIVATDENGNETRQTVDLGLEWKENLIGIVHPNNLIADGKSKAELAVFARTKGGPMGVDRREKRCATGGWKGLRAWPRRSVCLHHPAGVGPGGRISISKAGGFRRQWR